MEDETYEYPYGDMQIHDALEDLDRRLKALEPKQEKTKAEPLAWAPAEETESFAE